MMCNIALAVPFSVLAGYSFDLIGRRKTLALATVLLGVGIAILPTASPSITVLVVLMQIFQMGGVTYLASPLLADYVDNSTLGSGSSLRAYGFVLGQGFTFLVMIQITKAMNLQASFIVGGATVLILGIVDNFFISEPVISNE